MPVGQQFLFKPERPLVLRLGAEFFKNIPTSAGVYKMHDARGAVVYVGKARNLRQRLRSYRVANPERMARRHLRLLQSVVRIDFDLCEDEAAALQHEAKLIRELRPKFNRAGVWQGKPKFLVWRFGNDVVEFAVHETPANGWDRVGPLGAYAPILMGVLVRLLWLASAEEQTLGDMPFGWMHNVMPEVATLAVDVSEVRAVMEQAFCGDPSAFIDWLTAKLSAPSSTFEATAITQDIEALNKFFERLQRQQATNQRVLL